MLIVVWKPIALILIYIELSLCITYNLIVMFCSDLREALPAVAACLAILIAVCSYELPATPSSTSQYSLGGGNNNNNPGNNKAQAQAHAQAQAQVPFNHDLDSAKSKRWHIQHWRLRWPPWGGKNSPLRPAPQLPILSHLKLNVSHLVYLASALYNSVVGALTVGPKAHEYFLIALVSCIVLPVFIKNIISGR